ncbi:MAG TPA: response regulator [Polyangiales bacterium]|nr:response regulator [Polyangiales bacterium]
MSTILIVDDSSMVRRYVRQALEALGFEVIEAGDGESALAQVASKRPALVISDVNMAPMNGFELLDNLRKRYTRQQLPILMLTTEADDAMKARGKEAGANGWLVKPFDPARMNAVVQHLLAASARAAQEGQAR